MQERKLVCGRGFSREIGESEQYRVRMIEREGEGERDLEKENEEGRA